VSSNVAILMHVSSAINSCPTLNCASWLDTRKWFRENILSKVCRRSPGLLEKWSSSSWLSCNVESGLGSWWTSPVSVDLGELLVMDLCSSFAVFCSFSEVF
jgi:hypothetical protein